MWCNKRMVYPRVMTAPRPNTDLPDDLKVDFEEARQIAEISPRGAAALLRLVIQKLCKELGEGGKNINDDIGALVKKGLPVKVQRALDTVRVVGNNAVHPGELDLKDDRETVAALFGLVNVIVEVMISQPKHIDALYDATVQGGARAGIEKRDGGKK